MDGKVTKMKCQKEQHSSKDHRAQIIILHQEKLDLLVEVHPLQTEFGNIIKVIMKRSLVFLIFIATIHLISQMLQ
jgi:hypothetical protein